MAKKQVKKPRFFRHFDTTVPVIKQCSRCGCWLAAGIAEGIHVQADLTALDPVQQQLVVLTGGRLFALTRMSMIELDSYRLRDPKFVVRYPGHRCGVRWESRLVGAGPVCGSSLEEIPF